MTRRSIALIALVVIPACAQARPTAEPVARTSAAPTVSASIAATPTAAPGGVISIAAGGGHSLALRGDGTLWAWGGNLYGQLGDGSTTASGAPVQVVGLGGATAP